MWCVMGETRTGLAVVLRNLLSLVMTSHPLEEGCAGCLEDSRERMWGAELGEAPHPISLPGLYSERRPGAPTLGQTSLRSPELFSWSPWY